MFPSNDSVTEIVAHFIGYLIVRVEDVRLRPEYQQVENAPEARPEHDEIRSRDVQFREKLDVGSVVVDVSYTPAAYETVVLAVTSAVRFGQIDIFVPHGPTQIDSPDFARLSAAQSSGSQGKPIPDMVAPGSTILIASQIRYLHDDDVVVVGDYEFQAAKRMSAHAELQDMVAYGLRTSAPLDHLSQLNSVPHMLTLMSEAPTVVQALTQDDFAGFDNLYVEKGETIDGRFSNGAAVDKVPSLTDALDVRQRTDVVAEDVANGDASSASFTIDASKTPTTMNISSGGNLAYNEVSIVAAGLTTSVVAIAGDYHRIDAIFQTNVLHDVDTIDGDWPGQHLSIGGNILQNSATFLNHDQETKTGVSSAALEGLPAAWNVTVIDGDMTFLNWVHQYNFASDNDTHVLTETGTFSTISTGLNLGFNELTFANLGLYFDLIIIGGKLYDGNFITQTNVLLDSDNLDVWGGSAAWKGSTATGENLLWNAAKIENVGADAWEKGLPDHYHDAATGLASGDTAMPDGFATDGALDGLGNLKVLFIAGDVVDINYLNQVNVVGDADDLAIYEDNLLKAQDSVWKVSTGHNTLINKASIVDYDSFGKNAYVGGEIYSDAVLVQADLLEGLGDRLTLRGNELANEVIAFLDDQTDIASMLEDHPTSSILAGLGAGDALQSVLA